MWYGDTDLATDPYRVPAQWRGFTAPVALR